MREPLGRRSQPDAGALEPSGLLRHIALASLLCAALVASLAIAFRYWPSEWLHDSGMIVVALSMPWVLMLDRLGPHGYWAQLVDAWIGLSLNVALARIIWAWASKRSSAGG